MQGTQEQEMPLTKKCPGRPKKIAIIEDLDQEGDKSRVTDSDQQDF